MFKFRSFTMGCCGQCGGESKAPVNAEEQTEAAESTQED
jgi:hypothetical protein